MPSLQIVPASSPPGLPLIGGLSNNGIDEINALPRHYPVAIKYTDLLRHGFTRTCPKCFSYVRGPQSGHHHSKACRTRILEALAKDVDGQRRIAQAEFRAQKAIAEHIEKTKRRLSSEITTLVAMRRQVHRINAQMREAAKQPRIAQAELRAQRSIAEHIEKTADESMIDESVLVLRELDPPSPKRRRAQA
jgi:hypothetical protein